MSNNKNVKVHDGVNMILVGEKSLANRGYYFAIMFVVFY